MVMRLYVIPTEGCRVRHPETKQPIPAAGRWVLDDPYWRRRLADGDVVEGVGRDEDQE